MTVCTERSQPHRKTPLSKQLLGQAVSPPVPKWETGSGSAEAVKALLETKSRTIVILQSIVLFSSVQERFGVVAPDGSGRYWPRAD